MSLHQERTHPSFVEGCFGCKIGTVRLGGTESLRREREGRDVTMGMGTKAYVDRMYRMAREQGRPDPVPKTREAAAYAPAKGPIRDRKYKEANNGL